jgi:hypothetical protein
MSNEITVTGGLRIRKVASNGTVQTDYQSRPNSFTASQTNAGGQTPGEVSAATAASGGTDISLSALTTPGFARFMNMDDTNFVTYGIRDTVTGVFYEFGELYPGEFTPGFRLSRNIGKQQGPGTGTGQLGTDKLHFRADTAACKILVEVFEK